MSFVCLHIFAESSHTVCASAITALYCFYILAWALAIVVITQGAYFPYLSSSLLCKLSFQEFTGSGIFITLLPC